MNRRALFGAALALVSALHGMLIFHTLRAFGPGLSVESASYVGAARSFARGGELLVPYASWTSAAPTQHLTLFPPLLPVILGYFERSGVDAVTVVRIQNAGLAALTLWLALCLVARIGQFTPTPGSVAGCALVVLAMAGRSPGLLYLWAWSEPLFLLFVVLFLHALVLCREEPERIARWALLGVFVGLASLTRTAGLSLLVVGLVAAVAQARERASMPRRFEAMGAVLACFSLLYAPWLFILRGVARESRGLVIPQLKSFIDQQLGFLGTCVLPTDTQPGTVRLVGFAILASLALFLLATIFGSCQADEAAARWTAITALTYLLVIGLAATSDRTEPSDVDGRYLAPFLLLAVLSLGLSLASGDEAPAASRAPRWFAAAAAALFLVSSVHRALPRLRQAATWGAGFERLPWRDSPLLAWLRLHESAYPSLYSNQPAGLYFGTRRPAYLALSEGEAGSAAAFRQKFESTPSLYVAFNDEIWGGQMAAEKVAERAGLERLQVFPDAAVYGLPTSR